MRGLIDKNGEQFGYLVGDVLYTLEGEPAGRIENDFVIDLAGQPVWRVIGDGVYSLDGARSIAYFSSEVSDEYAH